MKKMLIFVVLLNFLAVSLAAQVVVDPGKEIIGVIADSFNSRTKTFESGEGGFRVYFPSKPEKKISQIDNPFGLTDFIIYTSSSVSAFYGVTYFDTPTIITESPIQRVNYDRQRDALIDGLGATLKSERDVTVNKYSAREYVLENEGNTITLRTFFANQRLFRLMVITRGISEKLTAAARKLNQSLIEKFFDSFNVTSIPEPVAQQTEFPEDFGIEIENGNFSSEFFGLSLQLPKGFTVLEKEEAEFVKELGLEMVKNSGSKNKELIETSLDKTEVLLVATKALGQTEEKPAVFVIGAEIYSFPVFKPESVAEFLAKDLLEKNEELTIGVQKEVIDGVEFAWFETFDKVENSRHRLYLANLNKLVLEISFIYQSPDDLPELLKTLKSVKFSKRIGAK